MKRPDIDELMRLQQAATRGKDKWKTENRWIISSDECRNVALCDAPVTGQRTADYIAELHNNLPAIAAYIEHLEQRNEMLEANMEDYDDLLEKLQTLEVRNAALEAVSEKLQHVFELIDEGYFAGDKLEEMRYEVANLNAEQSNKG